MNKTYNVLVVGANGGIGRQAVEQALQAGHTVTAIMRTPANLPLTHPALIKIKGDIMRPESIPDMPGRQDLVISALGVPGGMLGDKPTTLYSQGNIHLMEWMKTNSVRQAFFISASAIEISPVMPFMARFATKYIVQKLLRHMYADQREMEKVVKASGLDWTIIRPPRLTDAPPTGNYRFSINTFLKNCLSISRADVAHFMIHHIHDPGIYQAVIEIGY